MILFTLITSASAGSICNDGWVSPSEGSGTCSYHGGIADYTTPSSGWSDAEGEKQAQEVALAYCLSLNDDRVTQACRGGLLEQVEPVELSLSYCTSLAEYELKMTCLEGLGVRNKVSSAWHDAHPPEPPVDALQNARELWAQHYGTAADVERLQIRKNYDRMMAIPEERRWMILPAWKLEVALQKIGRPNGYTTLADSDNLPTALKFVVNGTCVTYNDSLKTLLMRLESGNIVTVSGYGTKTLENTETAQHSYALAMGRVRLSGSLEGEFCFSSADKYPWQK